MVALLLVILLAVALLQAAVWIPVLRRWRKGSAGFVDDLRAQAVASGEHFVAGPEPAIYRGGSRPYSAVKGNGTMILTDRRLVFRKLTGGTTEVPTSNIMRIRLEKSFRGSRVGGKTHLVVDTADPAEIGFFVTDLDAWQRALDPQNRT